MLSLHFLCRQLDDCLMQETPLRSRDSCPHQVELLDTQEVLHADRLYLGDPHSLPLLEQVPAEPGTLILLANMADQPVPPPPAGCELLAFTCSLFKLYNTVAEDVRQMITQEEFDPETYMARMYHKFINNQVIQKQIKQFFSLLVNRRGGAVLWHCGAGKDRSGICSALLLYALGVPKDKIIEDYALSAESSEDTVEYILEKLFPADVPGNDEYQALARRIFGAKTCYIEEFFKAIEKDFISVDNYLQKAVELHVDNLVRLKTLYLK